jgi:2-(1,2-epoxy-1,2-dihydrophenyl)acetyl-CoA isomerase
MDVMHYKTILVEKVGGIAKITLNVPDKLNALDMVMREELKEEIFNYQTDKAVKVLVITGSGRAFCAGGDIRTMKDITAPAGRDRLKNVHKLIKYMFELEKPIISAVNGMATGAGLHIALASDIIYASQRAKFAESFVNVGLIPDLGGFYFLPLRIGLHRAKELMLTGRIFASEEAYKMGLINKVVPHEELDGEVMSLAEKLAQGPGLVYAMIKAGLNNWPFSLQTAMEMEANMQALCFETMDFKEGIRAFIEKRPPIFTGK